MERRKKTANEVNRKKLIVIEDESFVSRIFFFPRREFSERNFKEFFQHIFSRNRPPAYRHSLDGPRVGRRERIRTHNKASSGGKRDINLTIGMKTIRKTDQQRKKTRADKKEQKIYRKEETRKASRRKKREKE